MTYFDHGPADGALTSQIETNSPAMAGGAELSLAALPFARLSALRAVLQMLLAQLSIHIGRRGMGAAPRRLKSILRKIQREEKKNFAGWIKDALHRCPEWRARVFEDLGGDAALRRWNARLIRAHTPEPAEDYSWLDLPFDQWPIPEILPAVPPRPRRTGANPKTDRDGIFRWAKIECGRSPSAEREKWQEETPPRESTFFRRSQARALFTSPWPIEVSPSDLLSDEYLDESGAAIPQQDMDAVMPMAPHVIWGALNADHLRLYGAADLFERVQPALPVTNHDTRHEGKTARLDPP